MGILDRIMRRSQDKAYSNTRHTMIPRYSSPPERNSREWLETFRTSPRMAVVGRIASDLATVPGKLYRLDDDSTESEILSHQFLRLMKQPNPLLQFNTSSVWKLFEIYLMLKGEGYLLIERGADGMPRELWPVPCHWVQMTPYAGSPVYSIITPSKMMMEVPMADMFVMMDLNPLDPYRRGLGHAEAIADEIETDEYASKFQKNFFYNNATPSLVISLPGATQENLERFQASWLNRFKGVHNSHGTTAVNSEVKVERLNESMQELGFLETRKAIRDMSLEHWNVPREIMGITESSNRATSDAAQYIYSQNVLMPRLKAREDAINTQLVSLYGGNLIWRYEDIVPHNQEADEQKAYTGWNSGLLTKNEARELMSMPTVDNGDVYKIMVTDVFTDINADLVEESKDRQEQQMGGMGDMGGLFGSGDDTMDGGGEDAEDEDSEITINGLEESKSEPHPSDSKAVLRAIVTMMDQAELVESRKFAYALRRYMNQLTEQLVEAIEGGAKAVVGSFEQWLEQFRPYMNQQGKIDPDK
ncbi:hypothetical protein FACS1894184_14760 [Clostridia bacterium]|nr:hypothetical protein FACS1894184_14760 [Clostridia bacterium]